MGLTNVNQTLFAEGWVIHARPNNKNAFRYPIFNLIIPVHLEDSIEKINKRRFLSISAKDYLDGKEGSLKDSIVNFLKTNLAENYDEIWLQSLPRIFGYVFNPVSFWYCYKNKKLQTIVCEVNNTFGERHFYILKDNEKDFYFLSQSSKNFHVSPFFAVSGDYKFEFKFNDQSNVARIQLYQNNSLELDTNISLRFRPYDQVSVVAILKNYGWLTALIVLRIHMQALKLWLKGATFFRKPPPPKEKISHSYENE